MVKIAVDVMGGDHGPSVVLAGAAKALERHPDIRFLLFGLEGESLPILEKFPKLKSASEFFACEVAVKIDEKPSQELRHGRN
ncbi:MAG: phosphate acyltransferase PlsX, partial [Pararhizobium sp.]